jgi:hypothetical protein
MKDSYILLNIFYKYIFCKKWAFSMCEGVKKRAKSLFIWFNTGGQAPLKPPFCSTFGKSGFLKAIKIKYP